MRFSFSPLMPQQPSSSSLHSKTRQRLKAHWRVAALGLVAVGAVGVLRLPGIAQGPAIVPDNDAPIIVPLPEMAAPNSPIPSAFVPSSALPGGLTPGAFAPAATATRGKVSFASNIPQPAATESRISLEMRDTPVIDLLMLIAAQSDVQVTIGSDVDPKLSVPGIRLKDVTPEEAVRKVVMAAGLRFRKTDDGAYFVGKVLPDNGNAGRNNASDNSSSADASIKPIDEGWLGTNAQSLRTPPTLPSYNPPSYGGGNGNLNYSGGLVPLPVSNRGSEKDIARIRIRNVRSAMMAYWIDPQHQPVPIEIQASNKAKNEGITPYRLSPGVDPNVMAALNGNGSSGMPYGNPYAANNFANPYQNTSAANPWLQPFYRSNSLFGGGGGGGGGGIGGGGGGGIGGNRGGGGGSGGSVAGLLELGTDPTTGAQLVDQVISVDAQNVLLVYGTTEGIRKLNEIIEFLDRPIRQVEIESQFIDISVTEAKGFGISFFDPDAIGTSNQRIIGTTPDVSGTNTIVITRGGIQARIQALAGSGKARIINSPRVTTMNNLTAQLYSSQETPIVLTSTQTGIGGQVGQQQNAFFLRTIIGIQVTPTIQNDDTITVYLTPQVSVQNPNPSLGGVITDDDDDNNNNTSGAGRIPAITSQYVSTVANVKDNDVIVIGGLRTRTQSVVRSRIPILSNLPIIGRLFRSSSVNDTDRELVIFLTARIVRRTDDVTPIQGP